MPKLVREKELLKRTAVVFKNYPKNKPRITRNSNRQNTQHINIPKSRENIIYLYTPIYMNEYQIYEETKREIIRKIKIMKRGIQRLNGTKKDKKRSKH